MANNNENSPHKEELVKVDAEKEVIESSATQSESSKSGAKQKKSSGNGLLWFVVIILFLLVLGMAGAGYWYYMQQQSASQETVIAQQNNASQLKAIERERADILASIENVTRTNQALESTVAELKSQNEQLALQAESTLQQLNNMEGRRPADWLIAEADYLVRMAGRKLWLENDVRTAILLLVNADKRLKSLADPSVLPVRATLAEDIQTLQQLNPVSQSSVALALTGMMAQIDKLPLNTFEKPEDSNAQDTTLSESADDWQENLAKVWRSLVDDFLTVKSIEGPVEPVLSLEAQFLAKEQLRLQLMHAQTAALQGDEGLYSQSLQYAQTLFQPSLRLKSHWSVYSIAVLNRYLDKELAHYEMVSYCPCGISRIRCCVNCRPHATWR
jgi:uroporphyrin-3 C-methyltransferase